MQNIIFLPDYSFLHYKLLYLHYNLIPYKMQLRIKDVLKEKKVTALSLAEKIGIAQPSMSNIVNNKVTPSLDTVEKIADALGVPITELFEAPAAGNFTCPNCGASLRLSAEVSEGSIFD